MGADHEFDLGLRIGQSQVHLRVRAPAGPLSLADFLPLVQSLTDLTAKVATREAAGLGRPVRCGPRCGACCRQLVPVTPPEALRLRATIAGLDPAHRERVLDRFRAAALALDAAGLTTRLRDSLGPENGAPPDRRAVGLAYFALGLACPFLEDESCSIHPDRPLACREYLVSSDPTQCARPAAETVAVVELPRRLSVLFARLGAALLAGRSEAVATWVPLIQALDESAFDSAAVAGFLTPGPELFERLLGQLAAAPAVDPSQS